MNISLFSYGITQWQDFIEIGFFSSLLYGIALWLKKDTQKNLLYYFYCFLLIIAFSYFLCLTTITSFLLLFSPPVILLFMFLHQRVLTQNFITLKNIVPQQPIYHDWLNTLLCTTITFLHNNKELLVLIEDTDDIEPYLDTEFRIDASLSKSILIMLVENVYHADKMLWITSKGIIRGVNTSWKATWHPEAYQTNEAWIDDAIVYTAKSDAVLLHINPTKHSYTIAVDGTISSELTLEQASLLVRKKIKYAYLVNKKGYTYDVTSKKNHVARHLS